MKHQPSPELLTGSRHSYCHSPSSKFDLEESLPLPGKSPSPAGDSSPSAKDGGGGDGSTYATPNASPALLPASGSAAKDGQGHGHFRQLKRFFGGGGGGAGNAKSGKTEQTAKTQDAKTSKDSKEVAKTSGEGGRYRVPLPLPFFHSNSHKKEHESKSADLSLARPLSRESSKHGHGRAEAKGKEKEREKEKVPREEAPVHAHTPSPERNTKPKPRRTPLAVAAALSRSKPAVAAFPAEGLHTASEDPLPLPLAAPPGERPGVRVVLIDEGSPNFDDVRSNARRLHDIEEGSERTSVGEGSGAHSVGHGARASPTHSSANHSKGNSPGKVAPPVASAKSNANADFITKAKGSSPDTTNPPAAANLAPAQNDTAKARLTAPCLGLGVGVGAGPEAGLRPPRTQAQTLSQQRPSLDAQKLPPSPTAPVPGLTPTPRPGRAAQMKSSPSPSPPEQGEAKINLSARRGRPSPPSLTQSQPTHANDKVHDPRAAGKVPEPAPTSPKVPSPRAISRPPRSSHFTAARQAASPTTSTSATAPVSAASKGPSSSSGTGSGSGGGGGSGSGVFRSPTIVERHISRESADTFGVPYGNGYGYGSPPPTAGGRPVTASSVNTPTATSFLMEMMAPVPAPAPAVPRSKHGRHHSGSAASGSAASSEVASMGSRPPTATATATASADASSTGTPHANAVGRDATASEPVPKLALPKAKGLREAEQATQRTRAQEDTTTPAEVDSYGRHGPLPSPGPHRPLHNDPTGVKHSPGLALTPRAAYLEDEGKTHRPEAQLGYFDLKPQSPQYGGVAGLPQEWHRRFVLGEGEIDVDSDEELEDGVSPAPSDDSSRAALLSSPDTDADREALPRPGLGRTRAQTTHDAQHLVKSRTKTRGSGGLSPEIGRGMGLGRLAYKKSFNESDGAEHGHDAQPRPQPLGSLRTSTSPPSSYAAERSLREREDEACSVLAKLAELKRLREQHSVLDKERKVLEGQVHQTLIEELELERQAWQERVQNKAIEVKELRAFVERRGEVPALRTSQERERECDRDRAVGTKSRMEHAYSHTHPRGSHSSGGGSSRADCSIDAQAVPETAPPSQACHERRQTGRPPRGCANGTPARSLPTTTIIEWTSTSPGPAPAPASTASGETDGGDTSADADADAEQQCLPSTQAPRRIRADSKAGAGKDVPAVTTTTTTTTTTTVPGREPVVSQVQAPKPKTGTGAGAGAARTTPAVMLQPTRGATHVLSEHTGVSSPPLPQQPQRQERRPLVNGHGIPSAQETGLYTRTASPKAGAGEGRTPPQGGLSPFPSAATAIGESAGGKKEEEGPVGQGQTQTQAGAQAQVQAQTQARLGGKGQGIPAHDYK